MGNVRRIYVEKRAPYAIAAKDLKKEVKSYLGIKGLEAVRVLVRYDIENVSDSTYANASNTVFAEPPVDDLYETEFKHEASDRIFSVEYLPWTVRPESRFSSSVC